MKTAIQFGAGNIGRGFIGKLLADSGYKVYFADVNKAVIDEINLKKEYVIEVVGEHKEDAVIKNIEGIISTDERIIDVIANADIITTAVGPNILSRIASTLAKGIEKRESLGIKEPLNIIACENMVKASSFLKEEVVKYLSENTIKYVEENVGFPNSAVDRIVPPLEGSDEILRVRVEEFSEWIVDKDLFKGTIPEIKGMELTDNLMAFIERKLFTLNTGHAITAYLGVLKGYNTIKESIEDAEIAKFVTDAMKESGEVLIKRYDFDREKHYAYIEKILKRFKNPYLKDEVQRVGRQPLRKLSFNERLIKPLRGTEEYGTANDNLIYGIAAAMKYTNLEDDEAKSLQEKLASKDVKDVVKEITLLESEELIAKIIKKYSEI